MSEPKVIVCGVRCTWWDGIEKATELENGMLCCPHCKSHLIPRSEVQWIQDVTKHDDRVPGYLAFIQWARGKCYPNWGAAQLAHDRELKIVDTEDTQPSR